MRFDLYRPDKRLEWHKRFALFPVHIIDQKYVWLEYYERKLVYQSGYHGGFWYWEKRFYDNGKAAM